VEYYSYVRDSAVDRQPNLGNYNFDCGYVGFDHSLGYFVQIGSDSDVTPDSAPDSDLSSDFYQPNKRCINC
jgi:hypothetical protein